MVKVSKMPTLHADVVAQDNGVTITIKGATFEEVLKFQEKVAGYGGQSFLDSNNSGGHFLTMSATSDRLKACMCQPAAKAATAIYAFCKNAFGIPQNRITITV